MAGFGSRSLTVSLLSGRDGPVAHLAPDLRGDLRRGRGDQTRHLRLNRTTSWSLRTPLTFPESARRAFCSAYRHLPFLPLSWLMVGGIVRKRLCLGEGP